MSTTFHTAGEIGDDIKARLLLKTIAQGAETDLGRVVWMGRRTPDRDMIPLSVVIEGEDTPDQKQVGTQADNDVRFILFAFVPCDPSNPNVAAHAAIRDLKRAIFTTDGKADARLGGKVRKVRYLGKDIGPRADGEAFVLATIEIMVSFVEDLANP